MRADINSGTARSNDSVRIAQTDGYLLRSFCASTLEISICTRADTRVSTGASRINIYIYIDIDINISETRIDMEQAGARVA